MTLYGHGERSGEARPRHHGRVEKKCGRKGAGSEGGEKADDMLRASGESAPQAPPSVAPPGAFRSPGRGGTLPSRCVARARDARRQACVRDAVEGLLAERADLAQKALQDAEAAASATLANGRATSSSTQWRPASPSSRDSRTKILRSSQSSGDDSNRSPYSRTAAARRCSLAARPGPLPRESVDLADEIEPPRVGASSPVSILTRNSGAAGTQMLGEHRPASNPRPNDPVPGAPSRA